MKKKDKEKKEIYIPKIIGIRFGDNDFAHTIRLFLTILKNDGLYSLTRYNSKELTKELLVEIFNFSVDTLYLLGQHGEFPFKSIKDYLRLTSENVYFDQEVKDFIKSGGEPWGFNGDFHVMDNETFEPYIYTC